MKKFVYEMSKSVSISEFLLFLDKMDYKNPHKEEVLKYFNIDTNNIDIDEIEATLALKEYKKKIDIVYKYIDFGVLSNIENIDGSKINQLYGLLRTLGIQIDKNVLDSLRLLESTEYDFDFRNEVETTHITEKSLKIIFDKYGYSYSKIDVSNIVKIINGLTTPIPAYFPTIRDKYYDENNRLISYIDTIIDNSDSKLLSFSGEIYESLNFSNDLEAKTFVQNINSQIETIEFERINQWGQSKIYEKRNHEITEIFDCEFKTYIHFKGEEIGENNYNEIHLFKERNGIVIKFGGMLIMQPLVKNVSITAEELKNVIKYMKQNCEHNEIFKYAIRELENLYKVIENRGYIKKEAIIDDNSLNNIEQIKAKKATGNEKCVSFKLKIISSEQLKFLKEKEKTLIK